MFFDLNKVYLIDVRLNVRYNYFEVEIMKSINATNAREKLYTLMSPKWG